MSKISRHNDALNKTPNQIIEPKKGLSRRSIFIGVAGVTVAAGAGGVVALNRIFDAGNFFIQYPFAVSLHPESDQTALRRTIQYLNLSPYGQELWNSLKASGTNLRIGTADDKIEISQAGSFRPISNEIVIQSPSYQFVTNKLLCGTFFCAKSNRQLGTEVLGSIIFTLANEMLHARQRAKGLFEDIVPANIRDTGLTAFAYNIISEICSDLASLRVLFELKKIGALSPKIVESSIEAFIKKSEFRLFEDRFSKAVSNDDIAKATAETMISLIKSKRYSGSYEDLALRNMAVSKVEYERGDLKVDMSTPLSEVYANIETSLVESLDCGDFFKHLKVSDIVLQMFLNSKLDTTQPPQP